VELTSENVKSEQLGALGLLAAVIGELGIIEKIDKRLALSEKKGGIVSYGQRTAAMILNGLGFMNSRLYMTSHFFQNKPVSQLLGAEVTAENLNDDCLGRCLDEIAKYGSTKLYSEMAFEIAQEQGLLSKQLHLDTTTLSLYGRYEGVEMPTPNPTYGYSKDHRADLKQVTLSLIQGGEANLPLWMEALDGNSSDKESFHETVRKVQSFMNEIKASKEGLCFVVDAAFYDMKKLALLNAVNWITRVPSTVKEAKSWLRTEEAIAWTIVDENYKISSRELSVHGVMQRWVMVYSSHAHKRESEGLQRRMQKESDALKNTLWHLGNQKFGCPEDAEKAIALEIKKLKYHGIDYQVIQIEKYVSRGRPNAQTPKEIVGYRIESSIYEYAAKIGLSKQKLGRFILATNQLDSQLLSDAEVLAQYKEQSGVESGFKFIKNDSFELSSIFLKTPSRIGALMMVMTLCLMVYNFAQFRLRKCLKANDDIVPNQLGKPTQKPTLKWIAEFMIVIAVVSIRTPTARQRIVVNLNQVHRKIIAYFGKAAMRIYGLPPDYEQVSINYSNYKNLLVLPQL
jgi:transposase